MITLLRLLVETARKIEPSTVTNDASALETVLSGVRDVGFTTLVGMSRLSNAEFFEKVKKGGLELLEVPGNVHKAIIYYRPGAEEKAYRLRAIAAKYGGYLAWYAEEEDTREIGQILNYTDKAIEDYIDMNRDRSAAYRERLKQGI